MNNRRKIGAEIINKIISPEHARNIVEQLAVTSIEGLVAEKCSATTGVFNEIALVVHGTQKVIEYIEKRR